MTSLPPIEIDPNTFLREHFTLPTLPEVVMKIQQVIESDKANMAEVADLINGEPSLVAQVLKVANSAYYGLPREITNVKFALAFLGLNEVYRMVLSLSVVNTLAIDEKGELEKFWFHSFYAALSTKYLAKKYEPLLSYEELWSAAILHDIGKLIYLKFFPDHYKAILKLKQEEGCLFSMAEKKLSLPTSAFLGNILCGHWRLPRHIEDAGKCHTLEDLLGLAGKDERTRFKRMICLGALLAILSSEELNETTKHEIASAARSVLGCTESDFLTMMGDIYALKADVERFVAELH